MKKILIIKTSPRERGNSNLLAEAFAEGARERGNDVQIIALADKKIAFCRGCLACQTTKKCVIRDDANAIVDAMREAEVIVWATPVYYYACSGQMKTMIDRGNPLFVSDYKFRDVYLLAAAGEDADSAFAGTQKVAQGWVDCFENARLAGTVFAGGVNEPGDIKTHPALKKAFNLGKKIH